VRTSKLIEEVDSNCKLTSLNAPVTDIGIKKLNASFTADPVSAAVRAGYPLKKQPQNEEIRTPLMPSQHPLCLVITTIPFKFINPPAHIYAMTLSG
jgi:hypothetical protein